MDGAPTLEAPLCEVVELSGTAPATRRAKGIAYETAFWIAWWVGTALFVLDRFTTNILPRQSFVTDVAGLRASFGTDRMEFSDGPWTVVAYEVIARISGRVTMSSLNGVLFTTMPVAMNCVSEWEGWRGWVDFREWREANIRIHSRLGVLTGVVTLLHVWSVFLPVLFSGWTSIHIATNTIWRGPINEVKPCSDLEPEKKMVCLHSDDAWRLVGMTVIFTILFPISLWARSQHWRASRRLHYVCGAVYAIDILRRRSHPHTWILNLPVIALFFLDRWLARTYRTHRRQLVLKLQLDEEYAVVCWQGAPSGEAMGDLYYLTDGAGEANHPFTTLNNYRAVVVPPGGDYSKQVAWEGHKFVVQHEAGRCIISRTATVSHTPQALLHEIEGLEWNTAAIVKIHRNFTRRLVGLDEVLARGPFRSVYSQLARPPDELPSLLLFATGSGGGYLMDFVGHLRRYEGVELANPVTICYSTRSVALLQFVTDHLCLHPVPGLTVRAALTQNPHMEYTPSHPERDMQVERLDIMAAIRSAPEGSEVYFCGSPEVLDFIQYACAQRRFPLYAGHSFLS